MGRSRGKGRDSECLVRTGYANSVKGYRGRVGSLIASVSEGGAGAGADYLLLGELSCRANDYAEVHLLLRVDVVERADAKHPEEIDLLFSERVHSLSGPSCKLALSAVGAHPLLQHPRYCCCLLRLRFSPVIQTPWDLSSVERKVKTDLVSASKPTPPRAAILLICHNADRRCRGGARAHRPTGTWWRASAPRLHCEPLSWPSGVFSRGVVSR